MKRIFAMLLCLLVCLTMSGCLREDKQEDGVRFYYLQAEYVYGSEDGVIAPELREISSAELTMDKLLRLYLAGPSSLQLRSPFPAGTELISVEESETELTITLSSRFSASTGLNHTLACGCLARTCFGLTQAQQIVIQTEDSDQTTILTREMLTLTDDFAASDMPIGTEDIQD